MTDAQKAAFLQYRRSWRRLQDAAREADVNAQVEEAHNRPLRAQVQRNRAELARHAAAIAHHGAYVELTNPEPAQR